MSFLTNSCVYQMHLFDSAGPTGSARASSYVITPRFYSGTQARWVALQNASAATMLYISIAATVIKKNHHQYPRGAIKLLNQVYDRNMADQFNVSYTPAVSCIWDSNLNHSLRLNASTVQCAAFGDALVSVCQFCIINSSVYLNTEWTVFEETE